MSILKTIELKKVYGSKPNEVKALDGVNISLLFELKVQCDILLANGGDKMSRVLIVGKALQKNIEVSFFENGDILTKHEGYIKVNSEKGKEKKVPGTGERRSYWCRLYMSDGGGKRNAN
jgi:hypothetical protein